MVSQRFQRLNDANIFYIFFFYKSSSPPAVQENAATLFLREAPEMCCRLQNVTWLSISLELSISKLNYHLWVNLSFNVSSYMFSSEFPQNWFSGQRLSQICSRKVAFNIQKSGHRVSSSLQRIYAEFSLILASFIKWR